MSIKWKGEKLGVLETRRHYSNYFKGIPDFKNIKLKWLHLIILHRIYLTYFLI